MLNATGRAAGITVLAVAALAAASTEKQKVTYNKHVAPIVYQRCAECHRPGEAAPFSMTSYKETRPWAKAMKEAVLRRSMPPWHADPAHGEFKNDRRMSQAEIDTIVAWADSGAAEGDAKDTPVAPKYEVGWSIGKPDMVVKMAEPFTVPASGVVPYKYFTVDPGFTEDKWIQAIDVRADQRAQVHHIIVFIREPGKAGGLGNGNLGVGNDALLAGWAPGEQAKVYPNGMAKLVKAGSKFVFQMHYTPNGKEVTDQSYVGLKFANAPVERRAFTGRALTWNFLIPAGAPNHEVKSNWTANQDVTINGFMPHMHVRGKDFKYTAVFPDGRSEVLLFVPKYDFNWQLVYELKKPLFVPKGTRIECVAHYDNSANNKYNPDPTKDVKWGDQTWEEMMIGWFDYSLPVEKTAPAVSSAAGANE